VSSPVPNLPITYLEANADSRPRAPAVLDGDLTLTFAELRERVHAAAAELRRQGVGPGGVVAVSLPNVWEYVVLELAVPLLGAILLPLPLALGEAERRRSLERTGAGLLVEEKEAELLCSAPFHGPVRPPPADPERVVEIALTSGTTGDPKLASLHAGLKQATFEAFTSRLQVVPQDRVLIMSPVTQGIGGMCLYCMRLGAAVVMLRERRFTAEHALRMATRTGATLLVGVPTNVIRMLDAPALDLADLSSARCTAVAGAPMPPEVSRAWETRTGSLVCVFYGSMDGGQLAVGSPADPQEKRWTTVGKPHDCAELLLTAEGEICMRGPTVQERYWAEDHGPYAEDGWVHMGDLGFLDEDGYLHVTGRLKDLIIRGGSNINPHEVEDALRVHPAIADVCVVGRPDRELGERAVAFAVVRQPLTLDDLRRHLESQGLARYKWPEFLEVIDELPVSGPGKVDRRLLSETAAGRGAPAAPSNQNVPI
jgi:acyl-CoA synthetase (AMP-forming)/AMP-acid ligase II